MPKDDERKVPTHIDVVCPTCQARLHPRLKRKEYEVKCPDCFVQVRVPPLKNVLASIEQERRMERRDPVGTYSLGNPEQAPRELPKSVTVICRKCGARLDPELKAEARRVRCPDCRMPVAVPSLDEIRRAERRKKREARKRPEVGQYVVNAPNIPPQEIETPYLDEQGEIRREALDKPPQSLFFSDTFTFPWREDARLRWIFLSIGWTLLGVFLAMFLIVVLLYNIEPWLASVVFSLPAMVLGTLTAAYAAACCLPIIVDTSAGADRIESWPEPVMKEWAVQLMFVSFIGGEAIVCAHFIGQATSAWLGWEVWPRLVATYLLFPIFLLSSLEAGSVFSPLSGPVVRSLVRSWGAWLAFYLISGVMWCSLGALIAGVGLLFVPLCAVVPGPIFAAMLLIYARLLGRLAWQASQDVVERAE